MKLHSLLLIALSLTGCSGDDKKTEEPIKAEMESDATDESSEEAKLAAAEKGKKGGTSEDAAEAVDVDEVEEAAENAPDLAANATPSEPTGYEGAKVWKYVTSFALNVRSAPDKVNSTVSRHIKWGDKIEVVINGEWAKIGPGEYISSKHLSDNDPALKHSKGKSSKAKKKGK